MCGLDLADESFGLSVQKSRFCRHLSHDRGEFMLYYSKRER